MALYPVWVYANGLDSPKTFRTMREEQERADDRRDYVCKAQAYMFGVIVYSNYP